MEGRMMSMIMEDEDSRRMKDRTGKVEVTQATHSYQKKEPVIHKKVLKSATKRTHLLIKSCLCL